MKQISISQTPHKPMRNTNQLDFILKNVINTMWEHEYAWPFLKPLDKIIDVSIIPNYLRIIKEPIDLKKIKTRLENKYYWSGKDAIADIEKMFNNYYNIFQPGHKIYEMAKVLETYFKVKMLLLPSIENEIGSHGDTDTKWKISMTALIGNNNAQTNNNRNDITRIQTTSSPKTLQLNGLVFENKTKPSKDRIDVHESAIMNGNQQPTTSKFNEKLKVHLKYFFFKNSMQMLKNI